MIDPATAAKAGRLNAFLAAHASVVIAYSGGVDSAYLLAAARAALGDRALGVIADSASLPRQALKEAIELAERLGAPVEVVATGVDAAQALLTLAAVMADGPGDAAPVAFAEPVEPAPPSPIH